jgi:hypothetical protein
LDILSVKARVANVFYSSLLRIVAVRPLAMLRMAIGLSWWSSTIVSAELGEMGRAGVVGDHMEGKELMGVSTKVSMAMADIF